MSVKSRSMEIFASPGLAEEILASGRIVDGVANPNATLLYWLHDRYGKAHRSLAGEEPTLLAVRPDRHLGCRSTEPNLERLRSYLDVSI